MTADWQTKILTSIHYTVNEYIAFEVIQRNINSNTDFVHVFIFILDLY